MPDTDGNRAASTTEPDPAAKPKPVLPSKPRSLAATAIRRKTLGEAAPNGDDSADHHESVV